MITNIAKAGQFAGRSSVKTWVFTILRSSVIDAIKLRARTVNAGDYTAEGGSMDSALFTCSRPTNTGRPPPAPPIGAIRKTPCANSSSGPCSTPA
ncbi:MAG: hypothetical protein R3E34_04390 [Rhodocyclaceae bacterium]